jgi:hypothetical protein
MHVFYLPNVLWVAFSIIPSKKFLFERISPAIQRGNAASIRGTFPDSALLDIGNFCIVN